MSLSGSTPLLEQPAGLLEAQAPDQRGRRLCEQLATAARQRAGADGEGPGQALDREVLGEMLEHEGSEVGEPGRLLLLAPQRRAELGLTTGTAQVRSMLRATAIAVGRP